MQDVSLPMILQNEMQDVSQPVLLTNAIFLCEIFKYFLPSNAAEQDKQHVHEVFLPNVPTK